ncbi:heme-binding domain-containing protein [Pedobacter panaciterrae]
MNRIKAGLVALLIILFAMQLIQPIRNRNGQVVNKDSGKILRVPEQVQGIFKKSCYDCHSNQTEYPWYTYIQPIGWWMDSHVRKGKEELNFNEFGVYSKRRQLSKLKSIGQSIEDETMPLSSYTFIHKNTKLSKKDKALILDWVKNTINTQ